MSNAAQGTEPLGTQSNPQESSPLSRLFDQVRNNPLILFGIAGVFSLAILAVLLLWAGQPEYRALYNNLSEADGGRIISELDKRKIPYRFSENGGALLVPSEQIHTLRLQLAEQGLPQGGNVGFELLDNQAFGISQFTEQVNFQRGLEGELARSIESLGPVAKARIHLAMGRQSVFVREREPASASVVLNLIPGRELSEGQVNAIIHMVSSSVSGLTAESVTVVDQAGRLLSRHNKRDGAQDLDGTQLNYVDEVERSFQRRIENILIPIFGRENVRAQVVANIDFSSREQTAERFGPNQPPNEAAVRSQQISENVSGSEIASRGIPGALTNTPPADPATAAAHTGGPTIQGAPNATQQGAAANQNSSTLKRDQLVNYEVDRNIEHILHQRGKIQRLTAAVVINYREKTNDAGEIVREPLEPAELERINRLVKQAMGFSGTRGDELEVINSPFAPRDDKVEVVDWWKTPEFFNLAAYLSRYVLVAFVALLLWLMILRPIKRRHQEKLDTIREAAETAAAAAAAQNAPVPIIGENGEVIGMADPDSEEAQALAEAQAQEKRRQKRRRSTDYEHNLESLREMATNDPRFIAMIVKSWMDKEP